MANKRRRNEPSSAPEGSPLPALVIALIAVTVLAYAPVTQCGFINYDDGAYVYENPQVQAGLTRDSLVWAFTTQTAFNWHPVTWLSHLLDCQFFGSDPAAHHRTSVALHVVNAVVLFLLLKALTRQMWPSAVVAALFAVHPLNVESVVWVAERKNVLSTLFWLLTTWFYVEYTRQPTRRRMILTTGVFALGLMAKPMLVTLPFTLLLLDFWPLRRLEERRFGALVEKAPLFALTIASSVITYLVQSRTGAVHDFSEFSFGLRLGNAVVAYGRYIAKTLWPTDLAIFYPYPRAVSTVALVLAIGVLVGASAFSVLQRRRWPWFFVGWFWFVGTLVPVIGLVQVGEQAMADRYAYVPALGLFLIIAWALETGTSERGRSAMGWTAALVIATLAFLTHAQIQFWRSSITVFEHAIAVTADNDTAHSNLGMALEQEGRATEAMRHYEEALRITPDFFVANNALGIVRMRHDRPDLAVEPLRRAAAKRPDLPGVKMNLGMALFALGRSGEALELLQTAAKLAPISFEAHANLGLVLFHVGRAEQAVAPLRHALSLDPPPEARAIIEKDLQQVLLVVGDSK